LSAGDSSVRANVDQGSKEFGQWACMYYFFPTSIESHEVLDPIVFEQTRALHYFSPIPAYGLQIPTDQSNAQHVLTHTILCP